MTDTPPEATQQSASETVTERNARKAALLMRRRELVARLDARNLSQREIVTALAHEGILDEKGKPFSVMAVNRDLKIIYAERIAWIQSNAAKRAARVYGKIIEGQRMAFTQDDPRAVFAGIKAEVDLLGVNAPAKERAITWQDEIVELLRAGTITEADATAELGEDVARELIARARLGGAV